MSAVEVEELRVPQANLRRSRDEAALEARIVEHLASVQTVARLGACVSVREGKVILSGKSPTVFLKQSLQEAVKNFLKENRLSLQIVNDVDAGYLR